MFNDGRLSSNSQWHNLLSSFATDYLRQRAVIEIITLELLIDASTRYKRQLQGRRVPSDLLPAPQGAVVQMVQLQCYPTISIARSTAPPPVNKTAMFLLSLKAQVNGAYHERSWASLLGRLWAHLA